jgi:hypothetical protein
LAQSTGFVVLSKSDQPTDPEYMRYLPIALITGVAILSTAGAQTVRPPFVVEGSGRGYDTLSDAVAAIGDGKGTILIAPGVYRQCAVQDGGAVTYRAVQPGTAVLDGEVCEGKAALVLKGRAAAVDGLVFQNYFIEDGNGAGIRLQQGNLSVKRSVFQNAQEGILSHDDPAATISIDHSTFRKLGRCDGDMPCAHSIYIGDYGLLTVTNSRFDQGTGGHYVKSRSGRVNISGNSFDDSRGHLTNYMIDLSNGAGGVIAGNEMEQGEDKDNHSLFISIAPEGRKHSSAGLVIRDNVVRYSPGIERQSAFVANWSNDAPAILQNSLARGITPVVKR